MPSLRKIWLASKIQVCQKGIPAVQRNIQRKNLLEELKLFLFFGLWTRIFMVSGKIKLTELPELHSMGPEINFQSFSKKNKFDSILRLWEKNFRSFFATFGHGCQTRILSVQSPSWNKSGIRFIFNFPEFWRKLWFALKTCSFVRKAFNSPAEQLSGKNQTFLTLGLWGKNERLSLETWLADLPQTHSMPPQKQFEEKDCFFFHENITLNIFSDSERRTSEVFANFFAKGVKTELYLSKRTFW